MLGNIKELPFHYHSNDEIKTRLEYQTGKHTPLTRHKIEYNSWETSISQIVNYHKKVPSETGGSEGKNNQMNSKLLIHEQDSLFQIL